MALTLAGTAGCTSKSQEVASVNVTPGIAAESLQGMYDVVRVNGRRTLANFSVTFDRRYYGGHDGCNGFFGMGFGYGDRYFSAPASQTLMGCSPRSERSFRQLEQGRIVSQVVANGFTARVVDHGRMELRNGKTTLLIEHLGAPSTPRPQEEEVVLAGTNWEVFLINGARATLGKTADNQYLRFEGSEFVAKFTCDIFSGGFEQDGQNLKLSNVTITKGTHCDSQNSDNETQFHALLNSDIRFIANIKQHFARVIRRRDIWRQGALVA